MRLTGAAVPAGDWNGLVVICAANSWDAVKMMDRHLAERLTAHAPVLYVDPPVSPISPLVHPELRVAPNRPRLRLAGPSLARLTPLAPPGRFRPGVSCLTTWMLRLALRQAVNRLGGSVRAVVAATPLIDPFGACEEDLKVYWAQDDFVSGADAFGLSARRIWRGESRLASSADLIVAANPLVAEAWRSRGYQPATVAFGCDSELFGRSDDAPRPADVRLSSPIAGFIGHLSDRIDIRLLEALADRGRSLLLVGPRHAGAPLDGLDRLLLRPNVQWVGPKRFEELPSYQQVIDVGLVPYVASRFNLGSFPLKTLEYLAAGRPVVATDLPAIRWLNTDLVTIASEPLGFADAVGAALAQPRGAEMVERRRTFAARHDWTVRAQEFARLLDLRSASAPVVTRIA